MSLEVVALLKAFQNDAWSEADVVVGGAELIRLFGGSLANGGSSQ